MNCAFDSLPVVARFLSLPSLPDFCVKNAVKDLVAGDAVEAGSGEGGLGVGEMRDAEVGENAEGEVEEADVKRGDRADERAIGDGEIREEPESAGGGVGGEGLGEDVELGLGEAVEEEVGDDEVGVRGGVMERAEAWRVWRRAAWGWQRRRRSWSMAALVSTARAWRWAGGRGVGRGNDRRRRPAGELVGEMGVAGGSGCGFAAEGGRGRGIRRSDRCGLRGRSWVGWIAQTSSNEREEEDGGEEDEVGGGAEMDGREAAAVEVQREERGGAERTGERREARWGRPG